MIKISVVMPAYNAEQYIAEAIESILNQTFTDFELIIIDDGSTDRTIEIIEGYKDPRIRFYRNEQNAGVALTLNRGIELAKGEFVARMDSDDIAELNRLEMQLNYMNAHPEVAVLGTGIELFGIQHGTKQFSQSYEELKIDLLFSSCFAHPTVMMRTELLRGGNYSYNPAFSRMEDYDLWDRISAQHPIASLPDILLRYRIHPAQVTQKRTSEDIQQIRSIKLRQLARLGIGSSDKGVECFLQYCDGSFSITKDDILLLSRFFETLKENNLKKQFYDAKILEKCLKSIVERLLYKLPFQDAVAITKNCGISGISFATERLGRGFITRIGGVIQQKKRQSKLKSKDFCIICNNCWGGFVYQYFGLQYNTPTVGLFILGRDFVKFAANLEHYLAQQLVFIPWEQSSYYDHLRDEKPYPVAKLDDIEIYFMHYHSQEEAEEKWNRRKQRINRDKLLFKLSERECCSKEDIRDFLELPLKNKICFSYDQVDGSIYVPELKGFVGDEMPVVDPYYDKVEILNSIR